MITFPCCKINLGLNVVSVRPDGYHDIETVFYPIPPTDTLEIKLMSDEFPCSTDCDLKTSGDAVECKEEDNLVVKAYNLLKKNFQLPRIHAHLFKRIPSQAGLGGGSSDAAYMVRLLDERFRLNMGIAEMERYAARLGADCPFFITAEPSFATGIGEILSPADYVCRRLEGLYIAIVKVDASVSTRDAYNRITPQRPAKSCNEIVRMPVESWRETLTNDFEVPAFEQFPILGEIKQNLYRLGAIYAQMSGSGSTMFGIFKALPTDLQKHFPNAFIFTCKC